MFLLSLPFTELEFPDLRLNLLNVLHRPLNGCLAVSFTALQLDILFQIGYSSLFRLNRATCLAGLCYVGATVVIELQTAGLADAMLLVTLLTEVFPLPAAARP